MSLRILLFFLFLPLFAQAHPVTAKSWIVLDSSGFVLDGMDISTIRPIASITKLLTAMIVIDSRQALSEKIKVKRYGTSISRQTLLGMALVRSDNTAAETLCQQYPTGYNGCVQALNVKAKSLGMNSTTLVDPTGLNRKNVSTAEDLGKLVRAAGHYPLIVEASHTDNLFVKTQVFKNTNPLVGTESGIIVSKTGFINLAGGCLVMMIDTIKGIRTVILLGSKNTHTRAPEALALANI